MANIPSNNQPAIWQHKCISLMSLMLSGLFLHTLICVCVYLFFLFLCAGTGKHPKCFHHRLEDCRVLCSLQHRFAAPVFPSLVAFRAMCSSKMRRAWNEWKDLSKGTSKQHFVDVFLIMFDHVSSAWPARRWELRSPEIASCFDLWWVVRLATGCSVGSIATFLYTTRYRPLPGITIDI